MKKIISVFLAVLMIAGCMAISFSASAEEITINITIKEPKIGETPDTDSITVTPIKYAKALNTFEYHEGDNMDGWAGWNNRPLVTGKFEEGKHYYAYLNFNEYLEDGTSILGANFVVNGNKVDSKNITGSAERIIFFYAFGELKAPADPEPQQSVCPWCGGQHEGFFQKIIGFFHRILAAIFGAKY